MTGNVNLTNGVNKGAAILALLVAIGISPAYADVKSKAAQEAAEYLMQRFVGQVAKEGVETLTRKIEDYAARHGEDFYQAIRKVGPQAFQLVEEAGEQAPQAVRVLSRFGEDGAVWVASRPKAMNLVVQHGEEAAAALVKHQGIAEPVIEQLGMPAVKALEAVGAQGGRRLAMLASEGGELAATERMPELLAVIAKYGDPAMDFVWKHKGVLGSGVALVAFLADPEPFITGAKDITKVLAENTVKPLAEVPATVAREAAGEAARGTNWTIVFGLIVVVAASLVAFRMRLKSTPKN